MPRKSGKGFNDATLVVRERSTSTSSTCRPQPTRPIRFFVSNPTDEDTHGIAIFPCLPYLSLDPGRSRPVVLHLFESGRRKIGSGRNQEIRRLRRKCHRRSRL